MEEFYIDVKLNRGMVRLQVDEVPPEQWDLPFMPQFIVEYHNGHEFVTLTLRLEQGKWHDNNTRFNDDTYLRYFDSRPDNWDPYYQSPLDLDEINSIGSAIARHMIVHLQAYMGLFVPTFPCPEIN
ncbi:hypothetical protein [Mucilaginibacter panaciglaebae]|uniref:Uncharacterized protein n=1 Tax=Mucilaginibacter panaciglaebae TaxID=502331 RepID=A0ABP7WQC1_9SPHI